MSLTFTETVAQYICGDDQHIIMCLVAQVTILKQLLIECVRVDICYITTLQYHLWLKTICRLLQAFAIKHNF